MRTTNNFVSTARADAQVGLIFKVLAGIVLFIGVLLAFVGSPQSIGETTLIFGLNLLTATGLYFLPKTFTTRSEITDSAVLIQCMKVFRVSIPLALIKQAFSDPGLFTGGYGLRMVGKRHRAYISGGDQVTLELHDGRSYTLSVESTQEFLDALASARTDAVGA